MKNCKIRRTVYPLSMDPEVRKSNARHERHCHADKLKDRLRLYLEDVQPSNMDCDVFLKGGDFIEIFGARRSNMDNSEFSQIVKISRKTVNGRVKSIYRRFAATSSVRDIDKFAVLSYHSLLALSESADDYEEINEIKISKGSYFPYYWYHPNDATRISMKLGVYGLIASGLCCIVSILLSYLLSL